jgi:hypothetical protein
VSVAFVNVDSAVTTPYISVNFLTAVFHAITELQLRHARVDEVRAVNSLEASGDDGAHP